MNDNPPEPSAPSSSLSGLQAAPQPPPVPPLVLRVSRLSKCFPKGDGQEMKVLHQVDLEFYAGQLVSIVGASGSGKSTFLNLLAGLEQPQGGRVELFDSATAAPQDLLTLSEGRLAELRNFNLGFIFQAHHLLQELTVMENITLPAFIYKAGKSTKHRVRQRAQWLLQQVGLLDRQDDLIGELSGGERQRVAVARALINRPKLILADEPTGNLDEKNSLEIFMLLKALCRSEQCSAILVTHFVKLAELSDLIYEIRDSKISQVNSIRGIHYL